MRLLLVLLISFSAYAHNPEDQPEWVNKVSWIQGDFMYFVGTWPILIDCVPGCARVYAQRNVAFEVASFVGADFHYESTNKHLPPIRKLKVYSDGYSFFALGRVRLRDLKKYKRFR